MDILCQGRLGREAALSLLPEVQNTEGTRESLFLLLMEQIVFILIMNKKRLSLQRCESTCGFPKPLSGRGGDH